MKHVFFIILPFVGLVLTSCSSLSKLEVRYESPSFSSVVLDDYTGKPIKGATVQVSWTAFRRTGNEHNPDMMDICRITATTDEHGIYTIPAWTSNVGIAWEYYLGPRGGRYENGFRHIPEFGNSS